MRLCARLQLIHTTSCDARPAVLEGLVGVALPGARVLHAVESVQLWNQSKCAATCCTNPDRATEPQRSARTSSCAARSTASRPTPLVSEPPRTARIRQRGASAPSDRGSPACRGSASRARGSPRRAPWRDAARSARRGQPGREVERSRSGIPGIRFTPPTPSGQAPRRGDGAAAPDPPPRCTPAHRRRRTTLPRSDAERPYR
jgi:hypothetical protein